MSLLEVVEQLEQEYRKVLESVTHMLRVRKRIVTTLDKNVPGDSMARTQCDCKELVLNLFVTVRLHHSLKENNMRLTSGKGHRNRKVLKFNHA